MATKERSARKRENPDLEVEVRLVPWIEAILAEKDQALYWAVTNLVRSCQGTFAENRKTKAVARLYDAAQAALDEVRAGKRGVKVVDQLDALSLRLDTATLKLHQARVTVAEEAKLVTCPTCGTRVDFEKVPLRLPPGALSASTRAAIERSADEFARDMTAEDRTEIKREALAAARRVVESLRAGRPRQRREKK